jgi:2-(1,2-epoxy-1,2-dihydrophenyl)acetyl-CoA isomerase
VAAGAGCSLALACDLVIASEQARFIQAFSRVGLVPDSGSTWFLPRLMGYARAAEMTFLAEPMDGATSERLGLVNRVVPADRLMEEARSLAGRLAQSAPLALALTKRALNRSLGVDLASQLDYEAQLQAVAGASADHAEGVAAFVAKRPPAFTGE